MLVHCLFSWPIDSFCWDLLLLAAMEKQKIQRKNGILLLMGTCFYVMTVRKDRHGLVWSCGKKKECGTRAGVGIFFLFSVLSLLPNIMENVQFCKQLGEVTFIFGLLFVRWCWRRFGGIRENGKNRRIGLFDAGCMKSYKLFVERATRFLSGEHPHGMECCCLVGKALSSWAI